MVGLRVVSAFLVLTAMSCGPGDSTWIRQLRHVAAEEDADVRVPVLVLEAGDTALPLLETQLERGSPDQQELAALGLGYLGGEEAVRLLSAAHSRLTDQGEKDTSSLPEPFVREQLCRAMASTGSRDDVRFLIASLQSADSDVVRSATESLAVLRASQTLEAAAACVEREEGRRPALAQGCEWARELIRGESHLSSTMSGGTSELDRIVSAVLASGVPIELDGVGALSAGIRWNPSGRWQFAFLEFPDRKAEVQFRIYVTEDGRRSLVETNYSCGLLCGAGYESALLKDQGQWRVTSLRLSWLS